MLDELVDEIDWTTGKFRLKRHLFVIVPLAWFERVNDISKIIKLNRICLKHIQIFITKALWIILIAHNLELLIVLYRIVLHMRTHEIWLLLVQNLDFLLRSHPLSSLKA